jgi:hypothetical protein
MGAASGMPLCRALDRAGLEQVASRLAELAQRPNVFEVRPLTRVRRCEHALRCWVRGESGAHIEEALAQLLIGALTLRLNPPSHGGPGAAPEVSREEIPEQR